MTKRTSGARSAKWRQINLVLIFFPEEILQMPYLNLESAP